MKEFFVRKDKMDDVQVASDKLVSPNPGVAYVTETNTVYFNNVVLEQNNA
jgi:hypothetical protein